MSVSNVNNAAAPRQVPCETLDSDQVPVDLDVLLLSGTFKKMCDDLGLVEQDVFPGDFPVKTISTRIFNKVVDWCKQHKDDPETVVEKDPLTQECKWFEFTEYDKPFFDVPVSELLEMIKAANYLYIERLLHYACQAVAACIKGKHPAELCNLLQQDCDLDGDRIQEIYADNPWLYSVLPGARNTNATFIPNEVLLTIFEKLPREDLDRLRLVNTQFDDLIVSSSKLSEQQGPLRVVTKVEPFVYLKGQRFSQRIDIWLRDGKRVICSAYEDLAKRLKFGIVQKMRYGFVGVSDAEIEGLSALLPVKSAWRNATVEVSMDSFLSSAPFEFVFTQLFLCKELILSAEHGSFTWSRPYMRLPGIAECNKLDICALTHAENQPDDVVEWLEREAPPEKQWSEPRQMVLHVGGISGGMRGLIVALRTAFSASRSPKPYVLRIRTRIEYRSTDLVRVNEKTQERLRIRAGQSNEVLVERAQMPIP
ncbi:S-phase kinase-associated protein 1 [Aphelenchoides avenae]|nr:S-phase kinase-associated protein 1 [Aphelenchus avenae]